MYIYSLRFVVLLNVSDVFVQCCVCIVLCRGFETDDGKASILLNTAVYGDVTIIVYHARAAFGGKVQGKVCCSGCVIVFSYLHQGHYVSAFVYLFVCLQNYLKLVMGEIFGRHRP